jgi:chromosome segregation protein
VVPQVRSAQAQASQQRQAVAQVQQQIQVLAAEQRNIEELSRSLEGRRERLTLDRNALNAPDEARLLNLQQQLQAASEQQALWQAQLEELGASVPEFDQQRRDKQQSNNEELARQADLSARLQALRALQEKVKTDGRLSPWLAKHGLDSLQGLWSRLHVEPGWEAALEAALRERLGALEVSRLDMVRGFAGADGRDAPPAKLAFYSPPAGAAGARESGSLKPLAGLLRQHDAAQAALLGDWLHGAFAADSLEQALAQRAERINACSRHGAVSEFK